MISGLCSLGLTDDDLSRWHDDDLSLARMALIRTHIATCAACRERLAAFETIGVGLRALQPPPLDVERLMAGLRELSPASLSATSLSARRHALTPRRSWRLVTGAASLAAVVVLSLLAGYLFTTHGRPFIGSGSPRPPLVIPLEYMPMQATAISMSSPTNGWAFGSKSNDGSTPVIALHYTNGKWTRVQTDVQGRINALKMLSASDGWLVGSNVYHYDGHSWQQVAIPHPQPSAYDDFRQIAAFSPSAVWITNQGGTSDILHYDGTTWTRQYFPALKPGQQWYYEITGIAMVSEDEGWAVGTTYHSPTNNAANNDIEPLGVLLHYTGGVWRVNSTYPNYDLATISMASASDGWIGGDYQTNITKATDSSSSALLRPFLWRLTDGAWKDAPVPNPHGYSSLVGRIMNIQMLSTTEGWMIGGIDSAARAAFPLPTLPPEDPPYYRLQNGQWVAAPMPATLPYPYNADQFAYVSPDEFWAMGGWGISHYYKGVWKNVV